MGENDKRDDKRDDKRSNETGWDTRTGQTGRSESSADPRTGRTRTGRTETGRTETGRTETGRTETRIENQKVDKVSVLKTGDPKNVPMIPDEAETKKPKTERKKRATKKQKEDASVDNMTSLLVAVFAVAGSRKGFEFWKISEAEARTIAEPLQKVLASYNMDERLGKYADHIALVAACGTVIAPRAIATVTIEKSKMKKKKEVKKIEKQIENVNRTISGENNITNDVGNDEAAYFGSAL